MRASFATKNLVAYCGTMNASLLELLRLSGCQDRILAGRGMLLRNWLDLNFFRWLMATIGSQYDNFRVLVFDVTLVAVLLF